MTGLLRGAAFGATAGMVFAAANWWASFLALRYARAYLVVLLMAGALAGALGGAILAAALRRLHLQRAAGIGGRLPAWTAIAVLGAGGTALVAYLGSAPRFAPQISSDPRPPAGAASGPPNVILVSLDTVRADRLGAYGGSRARTPRLDALAAKGARFDRAVAASSWTVPSHAAILTGRAPSHIGGHVVYQKAAGDVSIPDEAILLPEVFHAAGYHTAGFVGAHPLSALFGVNQGFDVFNDGLPPILGAYPGRVVPFSLGGAWSRRIGARWLRLLDPAVLAVGNYLHAEAFEPMPDLPIAYGPGDRRFALRATEVNAKVFAWLDRRPPRPLFLFVHYFDPHDPYDPPPATRPDGYDRNLGCLMRNGIAKRVLVDGKRLTDAERDGLIAGYDAEIAATDRGLGELLDRLAAEGILDNAVVAVVSDHGESFGEHGLVFHGHKLYDDLTRQVLILSGVRVPEGAIVTEAASGVDVAPTLVALAGLEPPGTFEGRSLVPLLRGEPLGTRPIFAEIYGRTRNWEAWEVFRRSSFSVELGGLKLIRGTEAEVELYDLAADPGETRNLAAERPEDVARLEALLSGHIAQAVPPPPDVDEEVDKEVLEGLRGLGYIQR